MGPMGTRGIHTLVLCLLPNGQKRFWSKLSSSGTSRAELATQVGFPLQKQMEYPSPDPCREGSPRGWAVDKGVTGANSLLTEHQKERAVGQRVFSVHWSLML